MSHFINRLWIEDDGVLSFEWTLLLTLVVIGIVAGLAGARDAIIDEFGDAAQGMLALDQSMTIDLPLSIQVHNNEISTASDSSFVDAMLYGDCPRADFLSGQAPQVVDDSIDETP
jgi:Flp pilus assembly pilin Flp